ncbi:hypothetical protein [Rahnella aquatilis]|uniref:hypothetical protein n=1 Tax=Rahnella aquatilis TaxID=34038 RepID=UPI00364DF347
MEHIEQRHLDTGEQQERRQAQAQLDDVAAIHDELVIAMVYPLEVLLNGVKP